MEAARSWLWKVATNVVRLRIRRGSRARRREKKVAVSEVAPSIEEIREREAIRTSVLESLLTLDPKYREVLLLRFFEELSWRDVAAQLDVPIETARTRAKRARVALREEIERRTGCGGWSLVALIPLLEIQDAHKLPVRGAPAVVKLAVAVLLLGVSAWVCAAWLWSSDATLPPELVVDEERDEIAVNKETASLGPILESRRPPTVVPEAEALQTTTSWSGRAVDERGTPLSGVAIKIGRLSVSRLDELADEHTVTGQDGRFTVPDPQRHEPIRLVAYKPGHAPHMRRVRVPKSLGDIVLATTGLLHLVVRDKVSDEALRGARVEWVGRRGGLDLIVAGTADGLGRAAVDLPRAGRASTLTALRVYKDGYAPRLVELPDRRRDGTGTAQNPREIYLSPSKGCKVRVLGPDGSPVADAVVEAWSCRRQRSPVSKGRAFVRASLGSVLPVAATTTRRDGTATLPAPPQGRLLVFMATRGETASFVVMPNFRAGRGQVITLRLRPAFRLEGRVESGGKGIFDAQVALPLASVMDPVLAKTMLGNIPLYPFAVLLQLQTDEEGRFVSPFLPFQSHGVSHILQVKHYRFGTGKRHIPHDYSSDKELVVELKAASSQRVIVVDTEGRPIAGATVEAPFHSLSTHTDSSGTAHMFMPAQGKLHIQIHAERHASASLICDGSRPVEKVTLSKSGLLVGRVVDSGGRAMRAHLVLHRTSEAGREYVAEVHTGDSGKFAFENAGTGPWEVVAARLDTDESSRHPIAAGVDVVTVTLPDAERAYARIEGSVVDSDGTLVTEYSLSLRPLDRPVGPYRPVLSGARFRFEGIPQGAYRMEVRSGRRVTRKQLELAAGEKLDGLRLSLPAWASLTGRVHTAAGTARPTMVRLRHKNGPPGRQSLRAIDSAGNFSFSHLAAGTYIIQLADAKGVARWLVDESEVRLAWGAAEQRSVRLVAAGHLVIRTPEKLEGQRIGSGRIVAYQRQTPPPPTRHPAGAPGPVPRPATGSSVVLVFPDGERVRLGPLLPGSARFDEPLAAGNYELIVTTGQNTLREPFHIEVGKTSAVDVRSPGPPLGK